MKTPFNSHVNRVKSRDTQIFVKPLINYAVALKIRNFNKI